MARHNVEPASSTVFRAFLDGTQRSIIGAYDGMVPIVFGSVAAVIRERVERRMCTWRAPELETCMYAPRAQLSAVSWDTLNSWGVPVDDTSQEGFTAAAHPLALRDRAFQMVQANRERVEQRLAAQWCDAESDMLFIDGSITGSETVATSRLAVGVVKSHVTLYAEGRNIELVMGLGASQRSSVFRVTSRSRRPVASWYLRMRDPVGRDPMWGLVRVEIAEEGLGTRDAITARANEVSGWVLAESSPLALPDGRWDTMVYGVRDCEEYLRAVHFES